jgi:hypothetical protein
MLRRGLCLFWSKMGNCSQAKIKPTGRWFFTYHFTTTGTPNPQFPFSIFRLNKVRKHSCSLMGNGRERRAVGLDWG